MFLLSRNKHDAIHNLCKVVCMTSHDHQQICVSLGWIGYCTHEKNLLWFHCFKLLGFLTHEIKTIWEHFKQNYFSVMLSVKSLCANNLRAHVCNHNLPAWQRKPKDLVAKPMTITVIKSICQLSERVTLEADNWRRLKTAADNKF